MPACDQRCFVAVAGVEFGQDVAHVAFHSMNADHERIRNLLVAEALRSQAEYLLLASGQSGWGVVFVCPRNGHQAAHTAEFFQHTATQQRCDGGVTLHRTAQHGQQFAARMLFSR